MRASINRRDYARFEGGTLSVADRLRSLKLMAQAGYPTVLTITPILPAEGWQQTYGELIEEVSTAFAGLADRDLTVELITHRFNAGSKAVLESWYPGSALDMSPRNRVVKRTNFESEKQV